MMTFRRTCRCNSMIFILVGLSQQYASSAKINAHLHLSVTGNGFHRTLQYDVHVDNFTLEECHIAIHLQLPSAVYVNVDELADLRHTAANTACMVGEKDSEVFGGKAKPQNVTLCAPLKKGRCSLELPIHQRYQYAGKDEAYVNVTLSTPKLLVGCKERVRDYRVSKISLCSPCLDLVPKWREVPYVHDADSYKEWQVPIGDSQLQAYITYATLLVTIFGTFFIVRAISQVTMQDHLKRD